MSIRPHTPSFAWTEGSKTATKGDGAGMLRSLNPATGEVVGMVPVATPAEVHDAVSRARAAQPAWAALGMARRAELLRAGAADLALLVDEIGRTATREMGKPLAEAVGEVRYCASGTAETLAELAEALAPEVIDDGKTRSTLYRDPLGVAAVITPWNFPVSMPHWMVLPALAAGNTVVLKPSEETPLCAQMYADALRAHLPPGVLEVLHGGGVVGKALVAADVDLIAFTGSRAAGKHILAAAAGGLKRVVLELGGKDPMIVLDDADLEAAARFAARGAFRNAGQVCVAVERIYVPASQAGRFVELLARETAGWKQGDGLEPGTRLGPMVNERQREHVLGLVRAAVAAGARLVAGGGHLGNFVEPTVLADVTPAMSIAREETFGPVACVTPVADDDEAVRLANDTPYGLGAVVFGAPDHAAEIARRLTAGMIGVNQPAGGAKGTPWVGARESGYGFHGGRDGHRNFTQTRVVSTPSKS